MNTILKIEDLRINYGAIEALKGVSIELPEGDIVAVLGANGAGKTTLLKSISRVLPIKSGSIKLRGEDLQKYLPYQLAGLGISHVPEGRRVFATLTVEENLRLGAYGVQHLIPAEEIARAKAWIFELFPILKHRQNQLAGTLSGGEQQMLAIGRGLISKPKILLLDEPSLGLAPILVQGIFQAIRRIHEEERVSILLIEQNVSKALNVAQYAYILETGKVAVHGPAVELKKDERVKTAYLGGARLKMKEKASASNFG
jgi:branched-chain amino acid transport system ATP-binding protein